MEICMRVIVRMYKKINHLLIKPSIKKRDLKAPITFVLRTRNTKSDKSTRQLSYL